MRFFTTYRWLLVVAFALSACGTVTGTGDPTSAAVVNGEEITVAEVRAGFDQLRQNPQAAQQLEGDTEGVVREQMQSQILTNLIRGELLEQSAEEQFGITVDDAEVEAERREVVEQVGGEERFEQVVQENNLTEADVQRLLRQQVYTDKVLAELTEDIEISDQEVEEFFEQNADGRFGEKVSARHILVETRRQAQNALERLRGGEDFARVARDVSTDPSVEQNAGDLGELTAGQTVPEFEEAAFGAEVGELVGPVRTQFGWHIIEVTGRTPQARLEDVEEDIRGELRSSRQQSAVPDWLTEQAQDAEIRVNPRFGTWNADSAVVATTDERAATEPASPPSE